VLAVADVLDFLADEFAGLCRRRLALAPRALRALSRGLLRHVSSSCSGCDGAD